MKTQSLKVRLMRMKGLYVLLVGGLLVGCVTQPTYDYTNYRAHFPRSMVVLPPLNETTDVRGTYSFLSSITRPIAEMGYYVYPVVLVDQLLKENGLPTPGEMHQAPLRKIKDVIGADSVLYITLKEYGTKFQLLSSVTRVVANARLVDTATATTLWEGTLAAQDDGGNNSGGGLVGAIINAAVKQALDNSLDNGRNVARLANMQLMNQNRGLLYGPHHPQYGMP
ncbi:MAG: DUF799 family lipoprotein [Gammaproteobacteria bacterium]|nr:DUF799 family lipoprotein [Gammaproteobacteria bacterium]